jgi:hypothetical protein
MNIPFKTANLLKATSFISAIKTRTWVIIGAIIIVFIGLMLWIAASLLSFLWGQAATGLGVANSALSQAEQQMPALRGQAERLAPTLTAEAVALKEQAERLAPDLVKSAQEIMPSLTLSDAAPAKDVSGVDIGSRFPGLVRSAFSRKGGTMQVDYRGKGAIDALVAHYSKEFVAEGFQHEVLRATPSSELHQFTRQGSTISLAVDQLKSNALSVQLISNR